MDYKSPIVLSAGADRNIYSINMQNIQAAPAKFVTALKMQLRAVTLLRDTKGWVASSVEGRIGLQYFNSQPQPQPQTRFAFSYFSLFKFVLAVVVLDE